MSDDGAHDGAHDGARGRPDGAGSTGYAAVAGEALRLIEALQHAAAGWGTTSGPGGGSACRCEAGAHDGPPVTCRACPVCRLLGALHHARPAVVEHLADAGASLAAALAEVAAAATAPGEGGPRGRDGPGPHGPDPGGPDPGGRLHPAGEHGDPRQHSGAHEHDGRREQGDPGAGRGWHGSTWSGRSPQPVQHIDVTD